MIEPKLFVKAVGGGISDDGNALALTFTLANGTKVPISFPAVSASSLMLDMEKVLGLLFEQQRKILKGGDPRTFFPMGAKRAKTIQGAIGHNGQPVLSLVLETGLRLDIGLPQGAIPDLIRFLQDLETARQKGPSQAH